MKWMEGDTGIGQLRLCKRASKLRERFVGGKLKSIQGKRHESHQLGTYVTSHEHACMPLVATFLTSSLLPEVSLQGDRVFHSVERDQDKQQFLERTQWLKLGGSLSGTVRRPKAGGTPQPALDPASLESHTVGTKR